MWEATREERKERHVVAVRSDRSETSILRADKIPAIME